MNPLEYLQSLQQKMSSITKPPTHSDLMTKGTPKGGPTNPFQGSLDEVNRQVSRMKGTSNTTPGSQATRTVLNHPAVKSVVGAVKAVAAPAAAIATGAVIGETYRRTDRAPAVSGRGAGRRTFNPKPERKGSPLASLGRNDDVPAALYPEGVSTGVGGGNAGQAQSIDSTADAYIPPTGTTTGNLSRSTIAPAGSPIEEFTMPELAERVGVKVKNPFLSESFPGSEAYGAEMELPSTDYKAGVTMKSGATPKATDYAGGTASISTEPTGYEVGVAPISAGLEGQRQLTPGAEGPTDWSKQVFKGSGRSFLDAKDSLSGLRAAEAERGIVYAGGQHYTFAGDGSDNKQKISRDVAQDVRMGSSMTDAIAKAKGRTEQTKDTLRVADPAAAQNPITVGKDGTSEVIDNQGAMHGAQMGGNFGSFNTGGTDTALNSSKGKQRAQAFLTNRMGR